MQDRVPTKPNRYAVYDDAHNFLRYEYHERADEPTQTGDALNKANLLPDDVVEALGLTGNPQVKDAFDFIQKNVPFTNAHYWNVFNYKCTENITNISTEITFDSGSDNVTTITCTAGSTYHVDRGDPEYFATLDNTTTSTFFKNQYQLPAGDLNVYNNKYFKWYDSNSKKHYIVLGDSSPITISGTYSNWSMSKKILKKIEVTPDDSFRYVLRGWSSNDFPNGVVDDLRYVYVGIPNFVGSKIETGSYTGTGTYGSQNQNTIALESWAKVVVVSKRGWNGDAYGAAFVKPLSGYSLNGMGLGNKMYGQSLIGSFEATTLSWYYTGNSGVYQLNGTGQVYDYVILG